MVSAHSRPLTPCCCASASLGFISRETKFDSARIGEQTHPHEINLHLHPHSSPLTPHIDMLRTPLLFVKSTTGMMDTVLNLGLNDEIVEVRKKSNLRIWGE